MADLGGWGRATESLCEWACDTMNRDHPYLRAVERGPDAAAELLRARRVALFLDGLDEIAEHARARALERLRDEAGGLCVVMTSRTDQFHDALAAGRLDNAAVMDLRPVRPRAAAACPAKRAASTVRRPIQISLNGPAQRSPSSEEFEQLLAAIPRPPPRPCPYRHRDGMRWGELAALRPRHLDGPQRLIKIEETIVEVSKKDSPTGARYLVKAYRKDDEPRALRVPLPAHAPGRRRQGTRRLPPRPPTARPYVTQSSLPSEGTEAFVESRPSSAQLY